VRIVRERDGTLNLQDLLGKVVERVDELYSRGASSDVTGVPTGFTDLDRMTSGLQAGDLVIVAGRPSMGKAQPDDAPVRTPTGWIPIGQSGRRCACSIDGQRSQVTGVSARAAAGFPPDLLGWPKRDCLAPNTFGGSAPPGRRPRVMDTAALIAALAAASQASPEHRPARGAAGHDERCRSIRSCSVPALRVGAGAPATRPRPGRWRCALLAGHPGLRLGRQPAFESLGHEAPDTPRRSPRFAMLA
jgi:hypothetical protein